MSGSCLLNDLEGLHLAIRAEFPHTAASKGVFALWPTSVPMVYKGERFCLANHEQNVCRSV